MWPRWSTRRPIIPMTSFHWFNGCPRTFWTRWVGSQLTLVPLDMLIWLLVNALSWRHRLLVIGQTHTRSQRPSPRACCWRKLATYQWQSFDLRLVSYFGLTANFLHHWLQTFLISFIERQRAAEWLGRQLEWPDRHRVRRGERNLSHNHVQWREHCRLYSGGLGEAHFSSSIFSFPLKCKFFCHQRSLIWWWRQLGKRE